MAKLFGSDDTEAVVRLITALLVLVLDPPAVLLTLAAAHSPMRGLFAEQLAEYRTLALLFF